MLVSIHEARIGFLAEEDLAALMTSYPGVLAVLNRVLSSSHKLHRMLRKFAPVLLVACLLLTVITFSPTGGPESPILSTPWRRGINLTRSNARQLKQECIGGSVGVIKRKPNKIVEGARLESFQGSALKAEHARQAPDVGHHQIKHANLHQVQEHVEKKEDPLTPELQLDESIGDRHLGEAPASAFDNHGTERETKEHLDVEALAQVVPDVVHVPLEDAVRDVKLAGWEDEWMAHGVYDQARWGKLKEPKIDFVYLCK